MMLCLNPCCNGIYSMRANFSGIISKVNWSLNPCCNGIYSMRSTDSVFDMYVDVLILVVMEYTQ